MSELKGWSPFQLAAPITMPDEETIFKHAQQAKVPVQVIRDMYTDLMKDTVYLNSRYQVNYRLYPGKHGVPDFISLSIKRRDKQRVGPERYRDFLRIKNELVGPLHEGFEIYPSMERNVDTANQYYIWVFADEKMRIPIGFGESQMSSHSMGKSHNEPFEEGDLAYQHLGKKP